MAALSQCLRGNGWWQLGIFDATLSQCYVEVLEYRPMLIFQTCDLVVIQTCFNHNPKTTILLLKSFLTYAKTVSNTTSKSCGSILTLSHPGCKKVMVGDLRG